LLRTSTWITTAVIVVQREGKSVSGEALVALTQGLIAAVVRGFPNHSIVRGCWPPSTWSRVRYVILAEANDP